MQICLCAGSVIEFSCYNVVMPIAHKYDSPSGILWYFVYSLAALRCLDETIVFLGCYGQGLGL